MLRQNSNKNHTSIEICPCSGVPQSLSSFLRFKAWSLLFLLRSSICIFQILSILNGHTHRDRKQCIGSVDAVMVGLHDIDDGCNWRHCQTQPPAQSDDQCSARQCVHCTLGMFCSAWVYFVNYELISHEPISLTDSPQNIMYIIAMFLKYLLL